MRVDFYLLGQNKRIEDVVFALVKKGYQEKWRVGIHINDKELIQTLDNHLWTKQKDSFIPHNIIETTRCQSNQELVMLFNQAPDDINTLDYFINCTGSETKYNNANGRIADLVQADESLKEAGRNRYAYYKNENAELNYHNIL